MTNPIVEADQATHELMAAYTNYYRASADESISDETCDALAEQVAEAREKLKATVVSGVDAMVANAYITCSVCSQPYLPERRPYRPYRCPACLEDALKVSKLRSWYANRSKWPSTRDRYPEE